MPDSVTIDLEKLEATENLDRVAQIHRLFRAILFSPEVTASMDDMEAMKVGGVLWLAELPSVQMVKRGALAPGDPIETAYTRRAHQSERC